MKRYFEAHGITQPECVVCAPGDGWDDDIGFTLTDKDWYTNIDEHLKRYKEAKSDTLKKSAQQEARAVLTEDIVARYASDLLSGTPFFLRRLFRGKPITLVAHSQAGDTAYELDIYGRKWRKLETWNDRR